MTTYGLNTLTADSLKTFKGTLEADDTLTYKYLVAKIGYDPSNSTEYEKAMSIYENDLSLLTNPARHTYKFICQMHLSKDSTELD